jgi:thioredoxin reductase (NADPH)
MTIEALIPVPDDAVEEVGTAARPVSTSTLVVGLLANTKRNAPELLAAVAALLTTELPHVELVGPVITEGVMLPSAAQLDDLVERCDLVLTGLGDCGSCSATTMHVATDLESRGVPTAAICTEPFLASASAMAARRGFPGYAFARVAHPVSSLDQAEIEERAREAFPQVMRILGLLGEDLAAAPAAETSEPAPPVRVEVGETRAAPDVSEQMEAAPAVEQEDDGSYDVAVVGGGLAALSSALFSSTLGLRTVVITEIVLGGELINLEEVVHFPGITEPVSGSELASRVETQALQAGAHFLYDDVSEIQVEAGGFVVRGFENEIRARTVIAAMGARRQRLGLDGESELEARGVSYCGTCDGPFFKGRSVAVVGDGDWAGRESLVLARYASDVTLVTGLAEPGLSAATRSAVALSDRIRVLPRAEVISLAPDDGVLGAVQVRDLDSGDTADLELAGLFVNTGMAPASSLLHGVVDLAADGRVRVDAGMRTSTPGLFAVGELRSDFPGYAVAAAGDGAAGAASARAHLAR